MMEMHLGTKVGRPARLLFVSAGLLVVSILLAAGQARLRLRATLDLASAPTAVMGTPLHVRLPRDAIARNRRNTAFLLPAPAGKPGPDNERPGRLIQFIYERRPGYVAPAALFKELKRSDPGALALSEPAKIGPLAAVDAVSEHVTDQRSMRVTYRMTCSPRGDVIVVEYTPLSDWTPSERRVLDAICATITLDGVSGEATPEQLQQRAGLRFSPNPEWRMTGPEFAEVPGLYVGADGPGDSSWVLGLVRTWLADADGGREALQAMAGRIWGGSERPIETRAENGLEFLWLDAPEQEHPAGQATGLGLVAAGAGHAAWIFAYGAEAAAKAATRQVLGSLRFADVPLLANLEQAALSGDEFVRDLAEQGVAPWWRGASQTHYVTLRSGSLHGGGLWSRDPLLGGKAGYQGFAAFAYDDAELRRRVEWQCDAAAQAYRYEVEDDLPGRGGGQIRTTMKESRATHESQVQRTIVQGRRPLLQTIDVSPRFVPRPLESVAEQNVAMKADAALLIDVVDSKTAGTLPRLLRNLPPDAAGVRRALVVGPDEPWGAVSGFDATGELVYRHAASEWMDSTTRAAAEEASPALREMLRRQGIPD